MVKSQIRYIGYIGSSITKYRVSCVMCYVILYLYINIYFDTSSKLIS